LILSWNDPVGPFCELAAAVADAAVKQDNDRAAVREALGRPQVQEVASKLGLDLTRATAAVDAMSGANKDRCIADAKAKFGV